MAVHGGRVEHWACKWGCGVNEILDFSISLNPLGAPPSVISTLNDTSLLERYPEEQILVQKISCFFGINPESVLTGNGSAELLYSVLNCMKPKRVIISVPTFSEYGQAAESLGIPVIEIRSKESLETDYEGLLNILEPDDLVILCNPNNPTGFLHPGLRTFAESVKDKRAKLLVDEAFLLFVEDYRKHSLMEIAALQDDILVLGSLTKIFASPGLRAGYLIAGKSLIEKLSRRRSPWMTGTLAIQAMVSAFNDADYLRRTIRCVAEEKAYLCKHFQGMGLSVYPSAVNYLLVKLPIGWSGKAFQEALAPSRILVRTFSSQENLAPGHIRIAIRNRVNNSQLVRAFLEIFYEIPHEPNKQSQEVRPKPHLKKAIKCMLRNGTGKKLDRSHTSRKQLNAC